MQFTDCLRLALHEEGYDKLYSSGRHDNQLFDTIFEEMKGIKSPGSKNGIIKKA